MNEKIWQQDGAKIVRHFEGCYTLEYHGKSVMDAASFDAVARYVWAEFMPLNQRAEA